MKKFLVVTSLLAIAGIGIYELYPHFAPIFKPTPTPPTPPHSPLTSVAHDSEPVNPNQIS